MTSTATPPPLVASDLFMKAPSPDVLTADFVIRSLRRRLWKAFQDDDCDTALRAYQATLSEFQEWLEQEQIEREQIESLQSNGRTSKEKRSKAKDSRKQAGGKGSFLRSSISGPNKAAEIVSLDEAGQSFYSMELKQLKGPILESQMNPSEPFIADDFISPYDSMSYDQPARKELPDVEKHERDQLARAIKRKSRGPRMAVLNVFRKGSNEDLFADRLAGVPALGGDLDQSEGEEMYKEDINLTTPLHEAARLGAGLFIRILLENGGDPNFKNGRSRTALHTCAGGFTVEEDRLASAMREPQAGEAVEIGIRAPVIPSEALTLLYQELKKQTKSHKTTSKAAKAVGRFMRSALGPPKGKRVEPTTTPKGAKTKVNPDRLNQLVGERMEAVSAVLSWTHQDSGEGTSINAVDVDGRTALHYAAETGREDVCEAILSNFGAMLTIVDEVGAKTPGELAGDQGHQDLAAQLEGRALLYIDPYGMDDILLENIGTTDTEVEGSYTRNLAAPFSWFKTLPIDQVESVRNDRLQEARAEFLRAIQRWTDAAAYQGLTFLPDDDEMDRKPSAKPTPQTMEDEDDQRKLPAKESDDTTSKMQSVMESAEKIGLDVALDISTLTNTPKVARYKSVEGRDGKLKPFVNLKNSHIERLLAHCKWNVSDGATALSKGPHEQFERAGIPLPKPAEERSSDRICLICYDDNVEEEDWVNLTDCSHGFCTDCLHGYLEDSAGSKLASVFITCPHHECEAVMAQSDISDVLKDNNHTLSRIHEATNEYFVSTAHDYRFCPHPGCSGVVTYEKLPFLARDNVDADLLRYAGAVCTAAPRDDTVERRGEDDCPLTYEGVEDWNYHNCHSSEQPRKAHRFCLACGEGTHWPVTCDRLEEWKKKIREEIDVVEDKDSDKKDENFADLAQKLWLKANTRPCPQCNVPIEKNEGCNHMTCTNPTCRHEFCWICRKDWSLHGTATGGFFRCNIWQEDGQEPADEKENKGRRSDAILEYSGSNNDGGYGTAIHSAREAYRARQEMDRFVHHYTRWEAHGDSAALEKKMAETACARLAPVVAAATEFSGDPSFNFEGKGLSFVHDAFTELLECRSVLKHSYAFSFFRYPAGFKYRRTVEMASRRREKTHFEELQSELETVTEQVSDVVARSHLRSTKVQITYLTAQAALRRADFSRRMLSILTSERREIQEEERAQKVAKAAAESHWRRKKAGKLSFPNIANVVDDTWSDSDDEVYTAGSRRIAAVSESFLGAMEDYFGRHQAPEERDGLGTRMWECRACTFMNHGGRRCEMCNTGRQ